MTVAVRLWTILARQRENQRSRTVEDWKVLCACARGNGADFMARIFRRKMKGCVEGKPYTANALNRAAAAKQGLRAVDI